MDPLDRFRSGARPPAPGKKRRDPGRPYVPGPAALDAIPARPLADLRKEPFVANPWYVWDQRSSNACTSFAVAGATHFLEMKEHGSDAPVPSRLYIYFWELVRKGLVRPDQSVDPNGDWTAYTATIRQAVETVRLHGIVPAAMWRRGGDSSIPPWQDDWQFHGPPTDAMRARGADHLAVPHFWVAQDARAVQASLIEGYPVTVLIQVHQSVLRAKDAVIDGLRGVVEMPPASPAGTYMQTGAYHAILLIGYDAQRREFLFRNSFGPEWGDQGYGRLPFAWVENTQLAGSLWTLRSIT